jgi:hypothetical protein
MNYQKSRRKSNEILHNIEIFSRRNGDAEKRLVCVVCAGFLGRAFIDWLALVRIRKE